jgi:hypothetical protein
MPCQGYPFPLARDRAIEIVRLLHLPFCLRSYALKFRFPFRPRTNLAWIELSEIASEYGNFVLVVKKISLGVGDQGVAPAGTRCGKFCDHIDARGPMLLTVQLAKALPSRLRSRP